MLRLPVNVNFALNPHPLVFIKRQLVVAPAVELGGAGEEWFAMAWACSSDRTASLYRSDKIDRSLDNYLLR